MKKTIPALIFVLLSFYSYGQQAISPELQGIVNRGELRIAMYHGDYVPFFVVDDHGELQGLDVQIARDLAEYLGVELVFDRSPQTFEEIVDRVAREEADIAVSYLSRTVERGKRVLFSKPYLILHPALLMNRKKLNRLNPGEDPIPHLNKPSSVVGVERAASYVEFAHIIFPQAEIIEYDSFAAIVEDLLEGKLHAGFSDEVETLIQLESHPERSIYLSRYVFQEMEDQIAIAVPPGKYHLQNWINLYLEVFGMDYTMEDLLHLYPQYFKSAHQGSKAESSEKGGGH